MAEPTDPDDPGTTPEESSVIKDLRAKAKRADEAEARAEAAERKLAFSEAGLSGLNEDQAKALFAVHDGEVNAESLKATAEKLGFGTPPGTGESTPAPQSTGTETEVADMARLAGSSAPSYETPPAAADELVKQINEFEGSPQDFEQFIMRNADLVLPPEAR